MASHNGAVQILWQRCFMRQTERWSVLLSVKTLVMWSGRRFFGMYFFEHFQLARQSPILFAIFHLGPVAASDRQLRWPWQKLHPHINCQFVHRFFSDVLYLPTGYHMRIRAWTYSGAKWGWISVLLLGSAKSVNLISKPPHKTKVQARTGIHGSWSSLMAGGHTTMCQRGSTAKSQLETVGRVSGSLNGWVTQPQLETTTTTEVISPWLVRVLPHWTKWQILLQLIFQPGWVLLCQNSCVKFKIDMKLLR